MFKIGDFIINGKNGVCRIEDIGYLDTSMDNSKRLYYTLQPLYTRESRIYTPVDNNKVILRAVMTKQEALDLIYEIPGIEPLSVTDEKHLEGIYIEQFKKCDSRELVKVIKTVYQRRKLRQVQGKKASNTEEKYHDLAEDSLYGELAVALGKSKDQIRDYIKTCLEEDGSAYITNI